jgi:hypothetical protein
MKKNANLETTAFDVTNYSYSVMEIVTLNNTQNENNNWAEYSLISVYQGEILILRNQTQSRRDWVEFKRTVSLMNFRFKLWRYRPS